jgi:hypothetical protein
MIIEKSEIKYHHTLTYTLCILGKWGFKQKVPRKTCKHTASKEEKDAFKKRQNKYLWIITSNNNNNMKKKRKKDLR